MLKNVKYRPIKLNGRMVARYSNFFVSVIRNDNQLSNLYFIVKLNFKTNKEIPQKNAEKFDKFQESTLNMEFFINSALFRL